MASIWIVTKQRFFEFAKAAIPHANTTDTLEPLSVGGKVLICFCTGLVLPKSILERFSPDHSYNFHPGTPQYPGLDAHRWACYEQSTTFGATLHKLTSVVDGGPIVATLEMSVRPDALPTEYHEIGESSAKALYTLMAPRIANGEQPPSGANWTGIKRLRKQTLQMCNLAGLDSQECSRRRRAFEGFDFIDLPIRTGIRAT